jgi:RimJ/RimL family protein N-acetyltransferase
MVTSKDTAIFGLYDHETLIGSTAAFTDRADETGKTCFLAGSYIREEYRGHGLSKLFYEARIGWAKSHGGFNTITVGHREGNEASRRANQKFGFQFKETIEKQWGDGSTGTLHVYELRIR